RIRHVNHARDPGELDDQRIVHASVVAHEPDGRALRARHRGGRVAHRPYCFAHAVDVFRRGQVRHHDEHWIEPQKGWGLNSTNINTGESLQAFPTATLSPDRFAHQASAAARTVSGVVSAPSTAGPRMPTLTSDDTPGSSILT